MSKMYNMYTKYKDEDSSLFYLFKCGNFYIFLGDDAEYISKITTLKKTRFSKECFKCGFPLNSFDIYMNIFNELNLNVKVIEDTSDNIDLIIDKINSVNVDEITGLEALYFIKSIKELLWMI